MVTAIAAVKTYLVLRITMPDAPLDLPMISGLFALFFVLTAMVAYVCVTQLHNFLDRQRKERLTPGASEPAAKETVILRNASIWGLSQAEADVAIFVVKGFSNSEIAEMRGCAIATVKSQLGRIYHKSGLDSRYQLIAFVTDEVCAMAIELEEPNQQRQTRNMLPLVGRHSSAA
ncbi:helix-turn-helix transcriptional regulator [Pseudorhodobacter sp.]|uniref:helix-turn-helix transcriptional regulator n=1 Tax=Pseudorhodobacter sp. TaxID=1934400 RepID=UPI00264A1EFF|nr:helix-turn-helix transcriptional regulator [Pseudorhodobacter sp.]MDN5785912.1 helix-turn-helix transcriptional regulator [Pseudorhodobacter sp.]